MQPVFFHILRFIQFCNVNQPHKTDKNYDGLQKITSSSEELNDTNARLYSPLENLAMVEVIVPFRETFLRNKSFGIKIHKQNMSTSLGKNMQNENRWWQLYMQ